MTLSIEPVPEATAEVRALVDELNRTLAQHYADDQRHGLAIEQLFVPNIRFFLARLDGLAAGCGGVALFPDYAEVKRMYTRPAARGRGIAKAVLARLEAEARAAGAAVLRLETGRYQREATRLYEGAGFRGCGAFGPYAAMAPRAIELSLFYEKPL
jgi:putative acetyltransferase